MNFDKLRDFLDYYLPMLGIPGSDTVIYKDHKEIFRHQSGYDSLKDRTPVRSDALYNLYSSTKVATCVAAMQLIERGELLINDPVHAYFPEYKNLKVRKLIDGKEEIVDAKRPMLIRHLFSMSSGLDYNLQRPAIARVIEETGGKAPTLDVIRALPEDPILFEPGTHYQYSLSHDVLGGIVELVSGVKLGDYMKDNIFDPLGMKDTTFDVTADNYDRIATQYKYDSTNRCAVEIPKDVNHYRLGSEYQSGGAGLLSTVDDYILLADALANHGVGKSGNRILSSRSIDLMRSPLLDSTPQGEYEVTYHLGYNYCFGVRAMRDPSALGALVPVGAFGWDGAKLTITTADPQNRVAIFHAEHMGAFHNIVVPRLHNVIYACIDED